MKPAKANLSLLLFLMFSYATLHASNTDSILFSKDTQANVEAENSMLLFGITDVEEEDFYEEKPIYLLENSSHEKSFIKINPNIPYLKFIPNNDLVWHLFIQSIPTSYFKTEETLHILEIL